MTKDLIQWADAAMYEAQPILKEKGVRVTPRVFLLSATPDPLGSCAADMRMYRGDPVYSLAEITDEQRRWAWEELSKTHLNTPLEGVTVKFMIEAVTRSFTHQMVRQRVGAYYVQESLRFAVKRGLANEVAIPPSIGNYDPTDTDMTGAAAIWNQVIRDIEEAYEKLVDNGIPAEDARGILPHAVTTRIIYNTNLRALFEHAGNRLCTQAQFEWRSVFMGMIKAMREHATIYQEEAGGGFKGDAWQWELIATPRPHTFTPICYRLGKCAFMSQLDRGCTIRDRVNENHSFGITSEHWGQAHHVATPTGDKVTTAIIPEEWLANPWAGITTETNRPE